MSYAMPPPTFGQDSNGFAMLNPSAFATLSTSTPAHQTQGNMFWLLMIIALVVTIIIATAITLRHLKRQITANDISQPFSLPQLRQMHADGQIRDEEFERAKILIIS